MTYPNGRVIDLGYGSSDSIEDLFGLVKSVAISGESGNKVDYTRVGLARFVKFAYPQPGVDMSMIRPDGSSVGDAGDPYDGFDRFGRVQEMRWQNSSTGTPIDAWQWGFNEASNRTWKNNLVAASGQDEAYHYDGLYQVKGDALGTLNTNRTSIGGVPTEDEDFIYDPVGNWLAYQKDGNGSSVLDQSRSSNRDNQLIQIDGSSQGIEYDRAGNATKIRPGAGGDWTKHFAVTWDAWNRIVEVKDENGTSVQKNAYDGIFRRITKESGGAVTHTYWSDRWKPVEERVGSATTAARSYLWGERPGHRDELVLRDRDTDGNGTLDERLYATMDYFNGTAVLSTSGAVLERYAYSAFGVRRIMAADFSPRSTSSYAWDFGFQGQFRDAETEWYNYGYRFYVPLLGRWVNRDPIGERGGMNLYGFVGNDGMNFLDAFGREKHTLRYDLTADDNLSRRIIGFVRDINKVTSFAEILDDVKSKINPYHDDGKDPCHCIDSLRILMHGGPGAVGPNGENTPDVKRVEHTEANGFSSKDFIASEAMAKAGIDQETIDARYPGIASLRELATYMCKEGTFNLIACKFGKGEDGARGVKRLEEFFGEGNVNAPKTDVCASELYLR